MMNSSPDPGESAESRDFTEIRQSAGSAIPQDSSGEDMVGPCKTETSIDSEESGQSTRDEKIQEPSATATSRTDTSKNSKSSAKSRESLKIQQSSEMATYRIVVGPSSTKISKESSKSEGSTGTIKIQESSGMETDQVVVGPSSTEISEESSKSEGSMKIQKLSEMATDQIVVGPSSTEISKESSKSEGSTGTMKIQESSGMETDQVVVGPCSTKLSKESSKSEESTGTMKIQELLEMATDWVVVGQSSIEISEISKDLAKSGESRGNMEIQESPKKADQDMAEPLGAETSEKPVTSQREPDLEATESTDVGGQKEEALVPLNSQTGALVPVEDAALTSQSLLQWLMSYVHCYTLQVWSWCSWISGVLSQTQNDETTENPDNAETATPEKGNDECDARSNVDNEEYDTIDLPASDDVTKETPFGKKIDEMKEIMKSTCPTYLYFWGKIHTVGIFSRSSEKDFKWLTSMLESQPFHDTVSTVRPHYIFNNGRFQFMEDVSECTFGILYHTKNRGRINIVDVTDSLYDEELKYMSEHLGRGNVIVVVDDLEDTSEEMKSKILKGQHSITELAQEIFLFSTTEKKKAMTTGEIPEES